MRIFEKSLFKLIILIERKSLNDLESSIKDGRYSEQSIRLNSSEIHNHNIYYLIEGNIQQEKISLLCHFCLDHLFELYALLAKIFPLNNKMIRYRFKYQIKLGKQ